MSQEILTVRPPMLMKLILVISALATFIIGLFQGDVTTENMIQTLPVFGVFLFIAILHFLRMRGYHATLFTDRLVVRNFWGKKEYPFQGLTGFGNIVTTSTGGNPIWIRSFEMYYGDSKKRVRIAALGYKPGKQLLDTMQSYFQQVAAASQ